MADILTRRRTLPPYKDGSGLSRRDQDLARIEVLLREELSPPDEDAGPTVEPCPVNLEEVVEIARLSPSARPPVRAEALRAASSAPVSPARSAPPPLKTPVFHVFLQVLILLFVLSWVFILGIVVGRGHLWESGPVYDLVVWLEKKVGWDKAEAPPLVFVKESPDETDDAINWEDVRRKYGYSDLEPENGPATDDADRLANSRWLSAAPALLNYDGPSAGYLELNDPPPDEEPNGAADEPAEDSPTSEADPPVTADQQRPVSIPRAGAEETKIGPDAPVDAGEGRYAVQVASAYEETEAQRRVEKLRSQGFPAYYYRTSAGRYPVRVGRFATRAEAAEAKLRLDALGYAGHYISALAD